MATTETLLLNVSCDIAGCTNSLACGSNWGYAEENGWKLGVPIDDSRKDLCPQCYGDLKAFTDGSLEDEADVMNLRDVLAGEQPREEYDE